MKMKQANTIININNFKSEKNLSLFVETNNYTSINIQINNFTTKYGIPSKNSLSSKNFLRNTK